MYTQVFVYKLKEMDMIDERKLFACGNTKKSVSGTTNFGVVGYIISASVQYAKQERDLRLPGCVCVSIKNNQLNFIKMSSSYKIKEYLFSVDFDEILLIEECNSTDFYWARFKVFNEGKCQIDFLLEARKDYIVSLRSFVVNAVTNKEKKI